MAIIAIDIDGTLAKYEDFVAPDVIGDPDPKMVLVIKNLHAAAHTLCVWTCRADYVVEQWLLSHDLRKYFTYINSSPGMTDSVKPHFDLLLDDKVYRWCEDSSWSSAFINWLADNVQSAGFVSRDRTFMDKPPVPYLAGTGKAYIDMFEEHWREACTKYLGASKKKFAFMTTCSHAKPYSKSLIHGTIRECLWEYALLDKLDYIHISNAGIIPSEAEMDYPFNAYDHNGADMTDDAAQYFELATGSRMLDWAGMYADQYDHIFVYLRDGKTMRAARYGLLGRRTTFVTATNTVYDKLSYARMPDPDDCLIALTNLNNLIAAVHDVALTQ